MTSPSDETGREGASIILRERLYAILRAIRATAEPTSGVRVGMLSYRETVAYDAIVALLDRVRAEATAAERARCQGIVCPGCRSGLPFVLLDGTPTHLRTLDYDTYSVKVHVRCEARALLAGTETRTDEGGGG